MSVISNPKVRSETIKVCIRLRPMLQHEDIEFWNADEQKNTISTLSNNLIKQNINSSQFLSAKEKEMKRMLIDSIYAPQNFSFDRVYSKSITSQQIYKELGKATTKSVLSGFNGTIFMYGQTTSGKTFTMLGSPENPGILPCAIRDIFSQTSKSTEYSYNVFCSYIEIYNENVNDLLSNNSTNLKLVDDSKYGVIVADAKRIKIKNFDDGIVLLNFGEENRKYRETQINEYSSRSHTIFQIFIESESIVQKNQLFSCLNLVDLAGSERLNDYDSKTEAQGETGFINKSLFILARVINKLAESKNTYIPYRDSKITRLLSQALGGNSLTTIICTASPATLNYNQTLSTLRFASRAKTVKNKATINEFIDDKSMIEEYKKEIKKLKDELTGKEGNNRDTLLEQIMKTNEKLANELDNYKGKYILEMEKNDKMRNNLENYMSMFTMQLQNKQAPYQNSSLNNSQTYNNNSHFNTSPLISANNFYQNNNLSNNIDNNLVVHSDNRLSILQNGKLNSKSPTLVNNSADNSKNFISNNEINDKNYVEGMILKYLSEPELDEKKKKLWIEETKAISTDYKTELTLIQNNYKEKILDLLKKIKNTKTSEEKFPRSIQNNQIQELKHEELSNNVDEIIKKIKNRTIFQESQIKFKLMKGENFEEGVKRLRSHYELINDSLETKMDELKTILENYFRNKVKFAKNFQLKSVDLYSESASIMNVTSEHNEILKLLRENKEEKSKSLEKSFFETLKSITSTLNNKSS